MSRQGIAPLPDRLDKLLSNIKLPTSVESLQRLIGFVDFCRRYISELAKKLILLYQLLQKDIKFRLTEVHKNTPYDISEKIAKGAKMSLRLFLPDHQQLVIICHADQHEAGCVWLNEDYTTTNYTPLEA